MAFVGMVIDKSEAYPDNVEIPRVVLPDNRNITHYHMGWDNFVYDEIENLVERYKIAGDNEGYELALCSTDGTVSILPRKNVVEDHCDELSKYCTIALVPKGTDPQTLRHLCPEQNPSEQQSTMKEEIEVPTTLGDSSTHVVAPTK